MKRFYLAVVLWSPLWLMLGQANADWDSQILSSWTLESKSPQQMTTISDQFEIVSRRNQHYEIYVPQNRIENFKNLAPTAVLNSKDIAADMEATLRAQPAWTDEYRDYEQVSQTLANFARNYPHIAKLEQVGISTQGRAQFALKISDSPEIDETEPELMLTAATHGDEIITTEVLLRLIEELLSGYGKDQRLTNLVDRRELFFVPIVNPDGFYSRRRYADGVDPNRDYPWPGNPEKRPTKIIANLINFYEARDFAGSLDFHAHGRLIMFPWAYTKQPPEANDERIFSNLGGHMAEENFYTHGQISEVIYVAKGSSADYYYWQHHDTAFAVEIADAKAPKISEIPDVLRQSREMTWRFIEHF